MLPIRVMTKDFKLLTEIGLYQSLQMTRSFSTYGTMELVVNKYVEGSEHLQKGNIVFLYNRLDEAYVIRQRSISMTEDGKKSEDWVIVAEHIKSWFSQRITIPPQGEAQDIVKGKAETVLAHYIRVNAENPPDSKRKIPNLRVINNPNPVGVEFEWGSRYKNLAEELAEISFLTNVGWNVIVNYKEKTYDVVFYEGKDVTYSQKILPSVIFSPHLGSLGEMSYTESDLNYSNMAYVAAYGEGAERRVLAHRDNVTGFDRYELFVDARDISNVEDEKPNGEEIPRPDEAIVKDLKLRGDTRLAEREQEEYIEGASSLGIPASVWLQYMRDPSTIPVDGNIVYIRDFDLGYKVTIMNRDWGLSTDAYLTEVKEIYENGRIVIEPVFGKERLSLVDIIKENEKATRLIQTE